jgi:hypothetical protein
MSTPYTCIRCGYKTKEKYRMKDHLYKRKKQCPGSENDVVLTEEIKEKILENRIYKIPKEEKTPTLIQNIQYNNTMNNYIKNLDTIEKLTKLMDYRDTELIMIEDSMERNFSVRVDKLKADSFKFGYDIDENRLFDIIDEISRIRRGDLQHMNIIYDDKLKELNLYKSGCWETLILERGVKEVIEILKDIFFDYYEKYLLRRIYVSEPNFVNKQKYKEDLERHYKFLGCFELHPFIKDKDDMDILGENDGDYGKYSIEEKWMQKYKEIVDNTKRYEINKIKKNIGDILKNNTKRNLKDLNQNIIDLLNIDEEFKSTLDIKN